MKAFILAVVCLLLCRVANVEWMIYAFANNAKNKKKSAAAWISTAPQMLFVLTIKYPQARSSVSVLTSMKGMEMGIK